MNKSFNCLPFEGKWSDENAWDIGFENCTMTEDFGNLKKGDKFDSVDVSFDCGVITFIKHKDGKEEEFSFNFSIKPT